MKIATDASSDGTAAARKAMIDSQLRTSGVNEPWVLREMARVPRQDHVPPANRGVAYVDRSIPLADGAGFLAPPLFYGRALAEAKPRIRERALVVEGGSGYLPALLEPLVAALAVITPDEAVSDAPCPESDRFDLVIVDGAIEHFPDPLARCLVDGGRAVFGLAEGRLTRLAVGREANGQVAPLPLAEMGIPRLPQFDAPRGWSF